jgi:hypothetical protein
VAVIKSLKTENQLDISPAICDRIYKMYAFLLTTHSLFRWLVLVSLLYALYRSYTAWVTKRNYTKFDDTVRHTTATICHVQFLIGLWLYWISPIVGYFLDNFKSAVHERDLRFFGMEHITMMFVAIVVVSIGSSMAKGKQTDEAKFKTIAIWYTVGLIIIFLSIPWSFSPFTSRPYFRAF